MRRSTLFILFAVVALVVASSLVIKEYRAENLSDDDEESDSGFHLPRWWPGCLGSPADGVVPEAAADLDGASLSGLALLDNSRIPLLRA